MAFYSTDAVFPHGLRDCPEDADMTSYCDRLDDGYSQTKWVAEQLVLRAMKHGLPATVYRLGKCEIICWLIQESPYGFSVLYFIFT